MTKPITVFAQEAQQAVGRGFALTEYSLPSGQIYNSVALFRTRAEAQTNLDGDIEDDFIEEGDYEVTELLIHPVGSVYDTFGFEVVSHLALQNNQSALEVRACIQGYYKEEERKIRHEADASSDGPSRA